VIKTHSLTLKRDEKAVIQDVDFSWEKGENVVILGPNGAGKSTFALGLSGIIPPSSGSIIIDSKNIAEYELKSLRKKIGIVFQDSETQFVTTDVQREIVFGLINIGLDKAEIQERAEYLIKYFQLEDILRRDPSSLSAGEKQIVAIASVCAMEPEYLVFDEVTSFLDRKSRERVYNIWEKAKSSMLIITQNFEEINFGERVILLEDGKISFETKTKDLEKSSHFSYNSAFFSLLKQNKEKIPEYDRILELFK
jgi:energy-coupling factor transport system ATP-binding protein